MARNIPSAVIAQAASTNGVPVADITVIPNRMRRLRPDVVEELAELIAAQGLLHPITLCKRAGDGAHVLVAGLHRLEAVRKLGHETVAAVILDGADSDRAQLVEIDENLVRADLTPAERAAHQAKRKEIYERLHPETKAGAAQAKGMNAAQGRGRQNGDDVDRYTADAAKKTRKSERSVQREAARGAAIPDVASLAGTSLDKGDELDALGKLPPDEQAALAERAKAGEKVSAKTRAKQVKRQEREQQLAEKTASAFIALGQEPPASVIVADPALRFKVRSENGEDRSAENHYSCGTVEEMIALKPPMADNAVVFMWTSGPQLLNSIAIVEGWGCEYKTYSGWDKEVEGTGYICRSRLELILIATKGNIPAPAPGEQFPQLFRVKRGKHSEKPDVVYEEIARLYPNLVKLEMFARKPRPGWRTWGNEVEVTEVPPAAPAPAQPQPSAPPGSESDAEHTSDGRAVQ